MPNVLNKPISKHFLVLYESFTDTQMCPSLKNSPLSEAGILLLGVLAKGTSLQVLMFLTIPLQCAGILGI